MRWELVGVSFHHRRMSNDWWPMRLLNTLTPLLKGANNKP